MRHTVTGFARSGLLRPSAFLALAALSACQPSDSAERESLQVLPVSTATAAPDTATATLIRRQRELLAILASQDRTDLDEYVDWDIVVQWADTSVSPRIATYTVFNLLNGDVALPHGANAEYRVVVSGPLGSVTSLLGERCVVTMWRRDTAGWHATKMQVLPTSPAPRLESIADSASPLLCHPSDNLTAALVRGVGEQ